MAEANIQTSRVVITDIDVSFWNWMNILVKIAFASVPAALIVTTVYLLIVALLGGVVMLS